MSSRAILSDVRIKRAIKPGKNIFKFATYMSRMRPRVAAIRGNTPVLRKMMAANISPVFGIWPQRMTRIPPVMRTINWSDINSWLVLVLENSGVVHTDREKY
jgi:hypothetical protein